MSATIRDFVRRTYQWWMAEQPFLSPFIILSAIQNLIARNYRWLTAEEESAKAAVQPPVPAQLGDPYEPTVNDVLVVKAMLIKALQLPLELVDSIMDAAEYWPHTTTVRDYTQTGAGYVQAYGGPRANENVFLIRSVPLGFLKAPWNSATDFSGSRPDPRPATEELSHEVLQSMTESPIPLVEYPCRKIVFTIHSHDQGWANHGANTNTYDGSWTWFEAGLERFDADSHESTSSLGLANLHSVWPETESHPDGSYSFVKETFPCPAHKVQANLIAGRDTHEHRVEWRWTDDVDPHSVEADQLEQRGRGQATGDGSFVRTLKLGDMVSLWAMARFPAWVNTVEKVQIDVFWAV